MDVRLCINDLPPEVLHIICRNLVHKDAASARFLSRKFSQIAAHYAISRVRIHSSKASLERLRCIADHEIFRLSVTRLVFDGCTVASLGGKREYTGHFEESHHDRERPRIPPATATAREVRLYHRNKNKYDSDIQSKWEWYSELQKAQQSLMASPRLWDYMLDGSVLRFPKLTHLEYSPARKCTHLTSKRFSDEFGSTCAIPLSSDSLHSCMQVARMLLPAGTVNSNLRSVSFERLSPSFFSGKISKKSILAAFSHLTNIEISFKIAPDDLNVNIDFRDIINHNLSRGIFKDALAAARHLKRLELDFSSEGAGVVDESNVFVSGVSWPGLQQLRLLSVSTTESSFVKFLKKQNSLEDLELYFMELRTGRWRGVVESLRSGLRLSTFEPTGYLQDLQGLYPMDLIYRPLYAVGVEKLNLSMALNEYVCESRLDPGMENPLGDDYENFFEEEILMEMYGSPSEISFSDDMDTDEMYDSDNESFFGHYMTAPDGHTDFDSDELMELDNSSADTYMTL